MIILFMVLIFFLVMIAMMIRSIDKSTRDRAQEDLVRFIVQQYKADCKREDDLDETFVWYS